MDVELPQGQADGPADADLVARVFDGDPRAYECLVHRYDRRVFAVAFRLLGNRQDALEVSQEAFLRAYQSLGTLQKPSRFGPWLLRIAGNLSLNLRRSRRHAHAPGAERKRTDVELEGVMQWWPEPRPAPQPDEPLLATELWGLIHEAMEELPDRQRLALTLFSVDGMSQKEVARILDCSIEAVKWYVFQARKTLKERLKDYLQ